MSELTHRMDYRDDFHKEVTGWHEAGHAIMAHLLGYTPSYASLRPEAENGRLAHVTHDRVDDPYDALMVSAAGEAAALAWFRARILRRFRERWDESGDYANMRELATQISDDGEDVECTVAAALDEATAILSEHIESVEELSKNLVAQGELREEQLTYLLNQNTKGDSQ